MLNLGVTTSAVSGGGILLDQGIHIKDLFNYFMGGFISAKSFLSTAHWVSK